MRRGRTGRARSMRALLLLAVLVPPAGAAPSAAVPLRLEPMPAEPVHFVAYGDTRFTDRSVVSATNPRARQALVRQVAAEAPAALFLNGDVPWHGGERADYRVFREETAVWRERGLRVFAALGNHEFKECAEPQCLRNWWAAFPELRGLRWYAVSITPRLLAIALDSNQPLTVGSVQRRWLEAQLETLPETVDFVFLFLHHPPVADVQLVHTSHNPRTNERALAVYLRDAAARLRVRFVVCAGHIHNYERREQDGIEYLVSGGGGAQPAFVERDEADRYQDADFPNFHYLRFTLDGAALHGEMFRLQDYAADEPHRWLKKDDFLVAARPR